MMLKNELRKRITISGVLAKDLEWRGLRNGFKCPSRSRSDAVDRYILEVRPVFIAWLF